MWNDFEADFKQIIRKCEANLKQIRSYFQTDWKTISQSKRIYKTIR